MKKVLGLLLVIVFSVTGCGSPYQEGEQYTKISETKSAKPVVREFYSYYCPICFRFEPLAEKIRDQLPQGVAFERNHVDFLSEGHAKTNIQTMMTKVYVTTVAMGVEHKITPKIFNYIHLNHAVFDSVKDVRNLLVLNGVDGDKFDKVFNSFSVAAEAKKMQQRQNEYAEKRILTGVPTIIVNEKYRINATKLNRDNFAQDYINLVNYLLTLD